MQAIGTSPAKVVLFSAGFGSVRTFLPHPLRAVAFCALALNAGGPASEIQFRASVTAIKPMTTSLASARTVSDFNSFPG